MKRRDFKKKFQKKLSAQSSRLAPKLSEICLLLSTRKLPLNRSSWLPKLPKKVSNEIIEEFEKSNIKVESVPKGIEELSSIKDFMNELPKALEKNQKIIKDCMQIYQTLDEFHHKFDDEEEYDKMWRVYGAPQETVVRIEKQ